MRFRLCAGTVGAILAAGPWSAAQTPVGSDFKVNTTTANDQTASRVARDAQGRTTVVWTSGAVPREVFLQRYNPDGSPLGSEMSVSSSPHDDSEADVATDAAGNFTVVWSQSHYPGAFDVMAQRFSGSGSKIGEPFRVNTTTSGHQYHSSIAMSAEGNFVVAWSNTQFHRVDAQEFSPGGQPAGGEIIVSQGTDLHRTPAVSWLPVPGPVPGGRFAVAWHGIVPGNLTRNVFVRVFEAGSQNPICNQFAVNTTNVGRYYPSTASDAAGNFVVAWQEAGNRMLRAHLYNSGCAPNGGELTVYQAANTSPEAVRAAMAPEGEFVATWQHSSNDDVLARSFAADGTALGPAFPVNTYTTGQQLRPAIALSGTRDFVITWDDTARDGSGRGIYGQRFGGLRPAALALAAESANVNGVWDKGETVTVKPSWQNQAAAPQSATGTASSLAGPGGPVYTIFDNFAAYGSIASGATGNCGNDCYSFGNALPTSTGHTDATFLETLAPSGDKKTWTLHVGNSFADVPAGNGFYKFAEILLHRGVTSGCGGGNFCPTNSITRQEMAVFLLVSKEGASYNPPACTTAPFNDVPASSGFCRWIAELARRGVSSGCGNGNFCPTAFVNRQEMAVFLLATLDPSLNPPACTVPPFNDVPITSEYCRWIKELVGRGITGGCGGGNYCPLANVPRQEMAVFLTATFGLTLYGPF